LKVAVTGAAGFIGSVVAEQLLQSGHDVLAIDNLQTGFARAVPSEAEFAEGDILDADWLAKRLIAYRPDAVVHLAAEAYIDESVRDPAKFFRVNMTGGLNLLDAMAGAEVRRLVFSSTAAVYGQPEVSPISEDAPKLPVNAYGESKLAFERCLPWYSGAYGLRHVSLRYFNACGATAFRGEYRKKETHIIPILFEVALGLRDSFSLFGTDYPTKDGTCVRDYIHVADIARAHILALENIEAVSGVAYNMGNGSGYTNLEVIEAVRRVTGHAIPVTEADRRVGDPAILVASSDKIRNELAWKPQFADLASMVATAWDWRKSHPRGYEG
jgi:UDP-glucose 4-epimerase